MSKINFHKVVAALPPVLEANSVYYVRVGTGFDQYITNSTGTIAAYSPNVKLPTASEVTISDAEGYFDGNNVEEALQQLAEGMAPAEIKSAYESNTNTNAFTDAEKSKLAGIAAGATANATNAQLRDRSTHTGTQAISTVSGLQTALDSKVDDDDARLTDAREWTASVVSQAEAEAGTATTARKWTAQRVSQAISALGLKIGTTATTAKAGNWTPSAAEIPNLDAGKITTGVFAAARIPILNQNTTGNAASATKLATARTINGVAFDGTKNITIAGGWTETTTSVNKTLAVRERCLVTAAGRTITLPASPTRGDEVVICVGAFENTTIGRNGQTILGKADNAVINREWSTVHLFFDGNTWRFA